MDLHTCSTHNALVSVPSTRLNHPTENLQGQMRTNPLKVSLVCLSFGNFKENIWPISSVCQRGFYSFILPCEVFMLLHTEAVVQRVPCPCGPLGACVHSAPLTPSMVCIEFKKKGRRLKSREASCFIIRISPLFNTIWYLIRCHGYTGGDGGKEKEAKEIGSIKRVLGCEGLFGCTCSYFNHNPQGAHQ